MVRCMRRGHAVAAPARDPAVYHCLQCGVVAGSDSLKRRLYDAGSTVVGNAESYEKENRDAEARFLIVQDEKYYQEKV